jgi:phenylalanyl-tRNA synthetase beta chain
MAPTWRAKCHLHQNPELNPRFVAFLIEGVEQKPSPLWMQRACKLAGQRPINTVVDISNYVMLEMGQPNHTFDYDVLRGRADQYAPAGPVHIITRLAEQGETLTTLDGQVRQLPDFAIFVTDPAGNLSLGGVMGGANSEISDSTTNVLLEAAAWNFMNIRRTANHLKIASEAGFRFSRGVHPSQAILGAKRAADLLRRYAGGTVAKGLVDYYPNPPAPAVVDLSVDYVRRWSGLDVDAQAITTLLEQQNFAVEAITDGRLRVTAPDYRIDIEGQHDLVEEVCRMYGYDNIPSTEISDVLPPQRNNTDLDREERRQRCAGQPRPARNHHLSADHPRAGGQAAGAPAAPDDRPYLRLQNVISQDRVAMRHSLLASVVEIAAENSKHAERIALFEVGKIYIMGEDGNLPDELRRLAMVYTGQRTAAHWQEGWPRPTLDFFDMKGVLEGLFEAAKLDGIRYEAAEHPTFRPGKTAVSGWAKRFWVGWASCTRWWWRSSIFGMGRPC